MIKILFPIITLMILVSVRGNASQYIQNNSDENISQKDTSDFLFSKFKKGVDFYGGGNEPSWSFELGINKFLRFNTMNGLEINLGSVKGEKAMDADIIRYAALTEKGFFSLTIYSQECTDNMSDEKFSFKVKAELNNPGDSNYKSFEGCGKYVPDYRLNRKWILNKLYDIDAGRTEYIKGLPELQFDAEAGKFYGNAGCNRIMGSFTGKSSYIKFSNAASTMMYCPQMEKEKSFLEALSKTTSYNITGNELTLSNPDGILMIFKNDDLVPEEITHENNDTARTYRLNDIWALENINGNESFLQGNNEKRPRLEIHVADKKFFGFGGCTDINGPVEIIEDSIRFGPAASTRKFCEGSIENEFLKTLIQVNNWEIKKNRLYLNNGKMNVLVFKKTD